MSTLMGLVGIIYGLYFVFTYPKGGFAGYLDTPSLVLLGLLPPSVMLLSHKFSDFITGFRVLVTSMFHSTSKKQKTVINALTTCAAKVRSEGVGSLVKERKRIKYPLLVDGLSLIINNFTVDEIRHNLKAKIAAKQGEI